MRHPDEREDILDAFAVEEKHDRETLERYLKEYPDLADDLIDLSSELRMEMVLGPTRDDVCVDTTRDAAWAQFRSIEPREVKETDPFARFKGAPAFAQLARKLNVPRSFLSPLCDGLIAAASIPEPFLQRLARAMDERAEVLRAFLARAQPRLPALSFKSDDKPSVQGQKTFREFVLDTPMADEQRNTLLKDCDDDGRD